MSKNNTHAILENIRRKIQRFDEPKKVDNSDFSSIGDEFEYQDVTSKPTIAKVAPNLETLGFASNNQAKKDDSTNKIESAIDASFVFTKPIDKMSQPSAEESSANFSQVQSAQNTEITEEENFAQEEEEFALPEDSEDANFNAEEELPEEDLPSLDDDALFDESQEEQFEEQEGQQPEDVVPEQKPEQKQNFASQDFAINTAAPDFSRVKKDIYSSPYPKKDLPAPAAPQYQARNEAKDYSRDHFAAPLPSNPEQSAQNRANINPFIANFSSEKSTAKKSFTNVDDFLKYNEEKNHDLLSKEVATNATDSIKKLMDAKNVVSGVKSFSQSEAFADIAMHLMEPKLEKWLNENLAPLVEKIVREEIKKIIPQDNQ